MNCHTQLIRFSHTQWCDRAITRRRRIRSLMRFLSVTAVNSTVDLSAKATRETLVCSGPMEYWARISLRKSWVVPKLEDMLSETSTRIARSTISSQAAKYNIFALL